MVAGDTVRRFEETAQKRFLRFGELRDIGGVLAAAHHLGQSDRQQIVQIVQSGIPGSRVLETLPARTEFFQSILPGRVSHATG